MKLKQLAFLPNDIDYRLGPKVDKSAPKSSVTVVVNADTPSRALSEWTRLMLKYIDRALDARMADMSHWPEFKRVNVNAQPAPAAEPSKEPVAKKAGSRLPSQEDFKRVAFEHKDAFGVEATKFIFQHVLGSDAKLWHFNEDTPARVAAWKYLCRDLLVGKVIPPVRGEKPDFSMLKG